jgi:hypothetical protein
MKTKCFKIVLFNLSLLTLVSQALAQHQLPSFYVRPGQTEVSPLVEDYRLIVSTTNTLFRTNQPLELTISLQNVSTNETHIGVAIGLALYYSITVTDPHGKALDPNEVGWHFLVPPLLTTGSEKIGPGNSYVVQLQLDWMFDFKEPGKYSVTVSRSVPTRNDPQKKVSVTCPPLKFQILGPKLSSKEVSH